MSTGVQRETATQHRAVQHAGTGRPCLLTPWPAVGGAQAQDQTTAAAPPAPDRVISTFHRFSWSPPEPFTTVLRWQRVSPMGSPHLPSPAASGVTRRTPARQTRENRTIPVACRSEALSFQRHGDRKACLAGGLAFGLSLGLQLKHQATGSGGGCLTRHAPEVRVRLGGGPLWRLQGPTCRAVCRILPPFVLR
jgi:hypothetical protein